MNAPDALPLVFGAGNDLLGWYHAPSPSNARDLGVVICAPHGYDNQCIHWALRILAERLATAGLPSVRFDFHGTGDSLGDDRMPGRVAAWLGSIGAAIDLLKANSGVKRVALLGIRLGATLAAAAASERSDIEALALYAPCWSGRSYVREQKALSLTRHPDDPTEDTGNPNDVVMAGWLISEQTGAALGQINLATLARLSAKDVLILHREGFPVDERAQAHLSKLGAKVTGVTTQDWGAFMQDALTSKRPDRDFATLVDWLVERAGPPTALPATDARPDRNRRLEGDGFTEEAVMFSSPALFGVLSIPKVTAPQQPLVVFLNTGANHHIGAHRSTVAIARALCAHGVASFRFDLSGLGDSAALPNRPQNGIYSMESVSEVVAALDFVQTRGFRRPTLAGLCSGSFLAFHTAAKDPRVRALVLVNAQRFTWKEGDSVEVARRRNAHSTDTYVQRALKLGTWKRLANGSVDLRWIAGALVSRGLKRVRSRASDLAARVLGSAFEVDEVPRAFLQILERGAQVLLLYGESDGGVDELAVHLGDNLRRLRHHPNAQLSYLAGSDHTLTTMAAQQKLIDHCARVALG